MVENIDKLLADSILNKCFRGLTYDASLRRHFVHIPNVDDYTLRYIMDLAATRNIHLQAHDLNDFLKNLADLGRCMKRHYTFALSDNEILVGESFRIYLNNVETYAELIKAKEQDYIVVNTKGNDLPKVQYIHVEPGFRWEPGGLLSFVQGNHFQQILDLEFLTPCAEHRCVDLWLEPNLADYEVTDNLWPLYNKTKDIMDDCKMQGFFSTIAHAYLHNGLSVFTLYRVIFSIENYWYGAD